MRDHDTPPLILPYEKRHRAAIDDLLFRSYRSHLHLDWQETGEWLDQPDAPIVLSQQRDRVTGVMGASLPLYGASWLRLAAISDNALSGTQLDAMWVVLRDRLLARGGGALYVLMLRDWLLAHIGRFGLRMYDEVITFHRSALAVPEAPPPPGVTIRLYEATDLPTVVAIDNVAFRPPWQLDAGDLRSATRGASLCLVADWAGTVVGYALCTLYFDGAHLARLAIDPAWQGRGVARALLSATLLRFRQRGVGSMTVNTQRSNTRSQALYSGYGFVRNGVDFAVWGGAL